MLDCSKCQRECCKEEVVSILDTEFEPLVNEAEKRHVKMNIIYDFGPIKIMKNCIFFDETTHKCTVYNLRPHMCRAYPCQSLVRPDMLIVLQGYNTSCPRVLDLLVFDEPTKKEREAYAKADFYAYVKGVDAYLRMPPAMKHRYDVYCQETYIREIKFLKSLPIYHSMIFLPHWLNGIKQACFDLELDEKPIVEFIQQRKSIPTAQPK